MCTYRQSRHSFSMDALQNLFQRDRIDNVRFSQCNNLIACLEAIAGFLKNPCSDVSGMKTCSIISQLGKYSQ